MEWVSIKEKLPELNKPVLVYGGTENHPCKNKYMLQSSFYKMSNCDVIVCGRDDMYWRATHWTELPPPPSSANGEVVENEQGGHGEH